MSQLERNAIDVGGYYLSIKQRLGVYTRRVSMKLEEAIKCHEWSANSANFSIGPIKTNPIVQIVDNIIKDKASLKTRPVRIED